MLYKNSFKKSTDLFRGLSVLKEEIIDKKTESICTVNKAWNIYLDRFEARNTPSEIWEEIENRFKLADYQYNVLLRMAKALEIVYESEAYLWDIY